MKLMIWIVRCVFVICVANSAFGQEETQVLDSSNFASNLQELTSIEELPSSADQVLVASTRHCPSDTARTLDFNTFVGYTCSANGEPCGLPQSLVEPNQYASTWIFVHGNQIPPREATKRGIAVYRRVRACSANNGPIRFVIWSWPSERDKNRIADARIKEHRTNVESFYLGSYISAVAEQGPMKLIAYSFGARVVGGGLHLSAGGSLDGRCLPSAAQPAAPHRVAFLAAAIANDGFTANGRYRRALDNVSHLLLQNNSRDQALRFYWIVNPSKARALGSTGMDCRPPHVTVHQYDWAESIGKDHSLWQYLDRPFVIQRVSEALDASEAG